MLRCEWKHRKYQCFLTLVKKNTVNYNVFGHLTLKNHGICSGFCFSPRKNTVNNSNFAFFSCFSLFFELRWSAIHGYQILRVFFFRQSVLSDVFGLNGRHHWQLRAAAQRCGAGGWLPSRSDVNIKIKIYILNNIHEKISSFAWAKAVRWGFNGQMRPWTSFVPRRDDRLWNWSGLIGENHGKTMEKPWKTYDTYQNYS